jgi:hypothetical protein
VDSTNHTATAVTDLRPTVRLICALAVVFVAVAMPNRIEGFTNSWLFTMPIEYPLLLLGIFLVPRALRWPARLTAVFALLVLMALKVADIAVYFAFARPFNPLVDVAMIPVALETLIGTNGLWSVVGAVLSVLALLTIFCLGMYGALGTIQNVTHRGLIGFASVAALVIAATTSIGTTKTTLLVREHAARIADGLRAADQFRADLEKDEFDGIPPGKRLAGLAGVDVILIFVESYGRSTLADPAYAPTIGARLKRFDAAIAASGFSARSAWLTSSTYGGESYLAHSSLLSGLWVDNRKRYRELLGSRRKTLIDDFRNGGWRTVAVLPQITRAWPEGAFFGYDHIYDAAKLEYGGQPFTYMTMPDQFTLAAFQQRELAAQNRPPVMAEIALISSHHPWTPIPNFIDWNQVGDGTIFNTARTMESVDEAWSTPERIRQNYVQSIDYVLETLTSFITTFGYDDMLFIVVGDHQPAAFMARSEAREVPVHIIARDPALLAALGDGWADGMTPSSTGMIAPINSMRARVIEAFAQSSAANATQALAP